jgi:hypothetical protein
VKVVVGGSVEDDAAAFLDAWRRADRGEKVSERGLAFESWDGLAAVMTGERYRLLRHLHGHPDPSVSALARALGASIAAFMRMSQRWSRRDCLIGPRAKSARRPIGSPPIFGCNRVGAALLAAPTQAPVAYFAAVT